MFKKARIQNNIITKRCLNSQIGITVAILWEEPIVEVVRWKNIWKNYKNADLYLACDR